MTRAIRNCWPLAFFLLVSTHCAAQGAEPASDSSKNPLDRLLEKPSAFQTLVNPNCSHCVDEAKRRAKELQDDERVLAWTRGKYDGGAIPVRFFLAPYRVISDTYGVFVYDPDAGYLRGYEPSLDFKFHGWRNGVMVMKHKDGTLFSCLSGRAFAGPRKGHQLKSVATMAANWGPWLKRYPGTVAYHMFDKYQPVELPTKENADSASTRLAPDERLEPTEEVIGVAIGGEAKAYLIASLEKAGGLIADELAGKKVYVLWHRATRTAAVYEAALDDAKPPRSVTLSLDNGPRATDAKTLDSPLGTFIDKQSGSRFDVAGRAFQGDLKGQTLRWLPGVQCRWFAWAAEYPDTKIHTTTADAAADAPAAQKKTLIRP